MVFMSWSDGRFPSRLRRAETRLRHFSTGDTPNRSISGVWSLGLAHRGWPRTNLVAGPRIALGVGPRDTPHGPLVAWRSKP